MKVFVDTDSDIRLVRRLQRDIMERGRDIVGVIKQYNKFVKPAFEQYIEPTVQVADIVVPRGETLCFPDLRWASGWVFWVGLGAVRLTCHLFSPVRWGKLCGPGPHCAACAQPAGEGERWAVIAASAGKERECSACIGVDMTAHSSVCSYHLSLYRRFWCSSWGRLSCSTGLGKWRQGLGT